MNFAATVVTEAAAHVEHSRLYRPSIGTATIEGLSDVALQRRRPTRGVLYHYRRPPAPWIKRRAASSLGQPRLASARLGQPRPASAYGQICSGRPLAGHAAGL